MMLCYAIGRRTANPRNGEGPKVSPGRFAFPLATSRLVVPAVANHRQRLELVVGRRARQGPFERRRAFAPLIVRRLPAGGERPDDVEEEEGHARGHQCEAVEAGDMVPAGEGVRIIW